MKGCWRSDRKSQGSKSVRSPEITLEGSELVTSDRVLDRQPALEPPDPEPRVVEVDLVTAEADRFADAQTVTKHHEHQEMIPDPVPSGLGGIEQGGDFGLAQKILAPLVGVGRGCRATFYISPVGDERAMGTPRISSSSQ